MSEEQTNEQEQVDRLASLKQRADTMGLKYHPSIGVDALSKKINDALDGVTPSDDDDAPDAPGTAPVQAASEAMPPAQLRAHKRKRTLQDARKLVRCRVTPMDPQYAEYPAQVFTFGNSVVPTIRRVVPFNVETHVENAILNLIKDLKYTHHYDVKDARGNKTQRQSLKTAFSVEILAPLTEDELKDLAQRQAMAAGTAEA